MPKSSRRESGYLKKICSWITRNWPMALGLLGTVVYLGTAWYLFGSRLDELRCLALNEAGDFLAGVFGPIALLWLVMGFFQQQAEIRLTTRALELQLGEMQDASIKQRDSLDLQRAQMEILVSEKRPNFVIRRSIARKRQGEELYGQSFELMNLGASATNVRVEIFDTEGALLKSAERPAAVKGEELKMQALILEASVHQKSERPPYRIRLRCERMDGVVQEATLLFDSEILETGAEYIWKDDGDGTDRSLLKPSN